MIAADEVIGVHFDSKIQIRFVVWVSWVGEMLSNRAKIKSLVRQKLRQAGYDFIRNVLVPLANLRARQNVFDLCKRGAADGNSDFPLFKVRQTFSGGVVRIDRTLDQGHRIENHNVFIGHDARLLLPRALARCPAAIPRQFFRWRRSQHEHRQTSH